MAQVATLLLALAVTASALRFKHGLQPQVAAKTLIAVENKWRQQSTAFVSCNTTGKSVEACQIASNAFVQSCGTVVTAMYQASSGDRASLQEYLADVCGQDLLVGWHRDTCHGLQAAITTSMTADAYENREDLDSSVPCQSFWLSFVEEEKTRVAHERAEHDAEEKKLAEERSKAEEAQTKADAKAAEEKAAQEVAAKKQAEEKAAREAAEKVEEAKRQAVLEAKRLAADTKRKLAEAASKKLADDVAAKTLQTKQKDEEVNKQMEEAKAAVEAAKKMTGAAKATTAVDSAPSNSTPVANSATSLANSTSMTKPADAVASVANSTKTNSTSA